jgi:pyruvate/2-oxoacid:ferredoxin oxidoreductase beta subunit
MKLKVTKEEYMYQGHTACPGCTAPQAMRYVLKVLGKKTVISMPACCWSTIAGIFPYSSLKVPLFHTAFPAGASVASGIKAGMDVQGKKDVNVLTWAGDGGTFDIGFQALSGAAERNEDIIYVCYDNEAYMNTGIQRSSATPWGAWTAVTPKENPEGNPKKDIVYIMAAHRIPYAATACVAYPEDLIRKMKKAKKMSGTRFFQILVPCSTGWKFSSELSIKMARMAVETKIFPLYEVENGVKYTINKTPKGLPIKEYLKLQGRFKHLSEKDIKFIQMRVNKEWDDLVSRASNYTA